MRDESLMHDFESEKEVMNHFFDSDSPTLVVVFFSIILKVAILVSAMRIFDISFYFLSNEWHLLLKILTILIMILGNFIAITQTSVKSVLVCSSTCQIRHVNWNNCWRLK